MTIRDFTTIPAGEFSLAESATFGFGQRVPTTDGTARHLRFDGVMRLAFCLDGYLGQVGVELRQDDNGEHAVHALVHGAGELDPIKNQVGRVISLDQDAHSFADVGRRDPVIGALQRAAPGLRPPLFYSPYEAAVWSVLSARRPAAQMAAVRTALSQAHGATFQLSGQQISALPTPAQLLAIDEFPGIDPARLVRIHAVARAALDGDLDAHRLQGLGPQAAMADVQRIKGIGPFYATLIVTRAVGFSDVLAHNEPKLLAMVRELYHLPHDPSREQFEAIADNWRPWRTWATVLLRAAGPRVLAPTVHEMTS